MMSITLLLLGLGTWMQASSTTASAKAAEQVSSTQVVGLLHDGRKDVPDAVIKSDASTIQKVTGDFKWDIEPGTKRREVAAAAWGAARAHKVSMEPLSVAEYSEALEGMTQIFVKSSPAGGDVKVDNFAWRQKTNADGYAQAGDRLIAVTLGPATLTVTCKVEQDRPVTAQVDFDKRTAICQ